MMEVVRLPVGEQAPVDADCVCIEQVSDISFTMTASALCRGADEADSVSIVDAPTFQSFAEAEAAGRAWAEDAGVEKLFISTGTVTQPLKLVEIDQPM